MRLAWPSAVATALLAALCGCASDQERDISDWERANKAMLARQSDEAQPALPAYPQKANLIEFFVSATSDFKFFIDGKSIGVDPKGIVRYVLVARSPSGVDNVSYEAMNCFAGEYRMLATGRADGSWMRASDEWKPIEARSTQRWHNELQRNYFCPNRTPLKDSAEGVLALQKGKHPFLDRLDNPFMGGAGN